MNKNFKYFKNRDERAVFISKQFKDYLDVSKNVLDVGCDNNVLKKIIGDKVTGIDLYGNPDFQIDLEKDKLKQFENNQFSLVICTEVLEHLDNFYEMIDELFRVSNKYILISLPNCMDIFTKYNFVFHNKIGKYYGLPLEKTNDRHKWFFFWKDLDVFFEVYCKKNNFKIIDKFLHFNFSNTLKAAIFRFIVKMFGVDSASQSYWILISK